MTDSAPMGKGFTWACLARWPATLVRSPGDYFARMGREGGYAVPLLYALSWQGAAGVVDFLISFVRPMGFPYGTAGKIGWLFLGPVAAVLFGFLIAAALFVIWHLMGSPNRYQTAYRVWASLAPLAAAGAVLRVVPYLYMVLAVYTLCLIVVASIRVHGIAARTAWVAWSVVGGLLVLLQAAAVAVQLLGPGALSRQAGRRAGPGAPGSAPMPADAGDRLMEEVDARRDPRTLPAPSPTAPARSAPAKKSSSAKPAR